MILCDECAVKRFEGRPKPECLTVMILSGECHDCGDSSNRSLSRYRFIPEISDSYAKALAWWASQFEADAKTMLVERVESLAVLLDRVREDTDRIARITALRWAVTVSNGQPVRSDGVRIICDEIARLEAAHA